MNSNFCGEDRFLHLLAPPLWAARWLGHFNFADEDSGEQQDQEEESW